MNIGLNAMLEGKTIVLVESVCVDGLRSVCFCLMMIVWRDFEVEEE